MTDDQRLERRREALADAGWRAALTIFSCPLLADRGEVWNYVDLDRREIHIEAMLENYGGMSSGEKALIDIALSLYTTGPQVNLYSVFARVDEANARLMRDAIFNFSADCRALQRRAAIDVVLERMDRRPRYAVSED
jgi:hypothetical protein